MKTLETNGRSSSDADDGVEIRLTARTVSRGVAIGKIVCLFGKSRQFYRQEIDQSQVKPEVARLKAAIKLARQQLKEIGKKHGTITQSSLAIFESHRMILEESSLAAKIEKEIVEQKIGAEWAVKLIADSYVSRYKAMPDAHLRDRYIDIEDVAERLLTALSGSGNSKIRLEKDSIIVARELNPSTLIELADSKPKAVITVNGGWTSHTFILAREANIPAVTGIKNLLRLVKTGDCVVMDGYSGQVIVHPSRATLAKYSLAAAQFQSINYDEVQVAPGSPKTLDGRPVVVRANADMPAVYKKAKRLGAEGIGLYRSEYLFNQFKRFPTEAEQFEAYSKIAVLAGNDGVRIRIFDLGVEQLEPQSDSKEKNPALGLRAVRLSLADKKQLKTQLRALLRASHENSIDIVLPMISGVSEIFEVKAILEREKKNMTAKGVNVGTPRVGAMIEVPAAVLMVKEIVEETDFLCLGTNDLVQYMLAADRDNESVAHWFRTLHPAVIRAVRTVIRAAAEAEKPVVVCGEMAGSPYYAPILIGLGATELSMNVNSILGVRKIISGIAFEEAQELVKEIEVCRTVEEIEQIVQTNMQKRWAHLFSPEFLRAGWKRRGT